jgi:hypothetical protein
VFRVHQTSHDGSSLETVFSIDRRVSPGKPKDDKEGQSTDDQNGASQSTGDNEPPMRFQQNGRWTQTPYLPIPTPQQIFKMSSSFSITEPDAADDCYFSLDGTECFLSTHLWETSQTCCTLDIIEGYLTVPQVVVLARTVHDYYQSYNWWAYQCYWYSEVMYNTIKMIVGSHSPSKTASASSLSPVKRAYREEPSGGPEATKVGHFQWTSRITVWVTRSKKNVLATIFERYQNAWGEMVIMIADRKRERDERQAVSDRCVSAAFKQ